MNCPYCKQNNLVPMSKPELSLTDEWDMEQLGYCKDCKKLFIWIYKESGTKKINQSTIFNDTENQTQ